MDKRTKQIRAFALIAIILSISLSAIYLSSEPPEMGTVITIEYEDGSTQRIDTNDPWYRLTQLFKFNEGAIQTTSGQNINNIKVECYITPTFSGAEIDYYTVSGAFQMRIQQSSSPYSTVYTSPSMPIQPLNPTLRSGQSSVIASATISTSNIQALYGGWESGKLYSFQYINSSPITVTIHFKDGASISQSTTAPQVSYVFRYV